ncbi:MAG TPA: tyrosine--tRNA ligase [Longimicrobiales bacterium]|nr:tyrosine--tRNA ligase [Longimicrobiales bacterium]
MKAFPDVNEQMDAIRADALEVIPEDELFRKLERSVRTGTPLRVKQGFDPTRPDLHIGHAVSMRKLHVFQELGHDVIFVVGDYTARIGDPSGRSETRPRLTPEEIAANAETYAQQVSGILDVSKVRIAYNSSWLAPLDLAKLLELTATYTVARMLERDDFAKRYAEQRSIAISEFMYPLMQAYDSVALEADVELGGSDQKFNLLVGRTVQERYGQEPQVCLVMPLLRGTDGVAKMSKSYDNYVGIAQAPGEQFGRTMSIPDSALEEWIRMSGVYAGDAVERAVRDAADNPYRAKRALARGIAALYHGAEAGEKAEAAFDHLFRDHGTPDDVPEQALPLSDERLRVQERGGVWLPGLLVATGLAASNGEAGRLIEQGAVSVDDERASDRNGVIAAQPGDTVMVRRGKRQFVRVTFT